MIFKIVFISGVPIKLLIEINAVTLISKRGNGFIGRPFDLQQQKEFIQNNPAKSTIGKKVSFFERVTQDLNRETSQAVQDLQRNYVQMKW